MKWILSTLAGLVLIAGSHTSLASPNSKTNGKGSQTKQSRPIKEAYRIPVRSANPWFIKAMLEGQPVISPEFTFIAQLFGLPPGFGQGFADASKALVKNGKVIVNPTDNSIWFIPDQN